MEAVLEKLLVEILVVAAQLALVRLLAWWRDRAAGGGAAQWASGAMPAI
jgi:hypothetical protein